MYFVKLAVKFLVYIAEIARVQKYTKLSLCTVFYGKKFLLANFSIFLFKYDEMIINFCKAQEHVKTDYVMYVKTSIIF